MPTPIIRTSERSTLKRCPQKWWWAWRMGLVPVGTISDALWFGTGVHFAFAKWYCGPGLKRGPEPAETFAEWADDELRHIKISEKFSNSSQSIIEEKLVPAKELGITLLEEYVRHYGRDDSWHVIEPERSGQVDIRDPDYPDKMLAIYAFTYDLVYRDLRDDRIYLGEHKTAKSVVTEHLPLDDQAGSYWLVATPHLRQAGLIGPKEKLAGITYNFVRKALPDTRPRNADGYYTNKPEKADYINAFRSAGIPTVEQGAPKSGPIPVEKALLRDLVTAAKFADIEVTGEISKLQPKPLFVREVVPRTAKERATQYRRIQGEAILMEAYRDGALPLTKTSTRNCQWDCQFYHMCLLDEAGADAKEYRRVMYRVEDPYLVHRKSTEEEQ